MKFIKYLIVFLLFVTVYTFADDEFLFRNKIKFGMSVNEVIKIEKEFGDEFINKNKLIDNVTTTLKYKTYAFEEEISLTYYFIDEDYLYKIAYTVKTKNYSKLLDTLKNKYGRPKKEENVYIWNIGDIKISYGEPKHKGDYAIDEVIKRVAADIEGTTPFELIYTSKKYLKMYERLYIERNENMF